MRESSGQSPRKNNGMIAAAGYPEVVNGFLRERFGPLRHAEKLLARAASVSPRTAENWLRGECAPRGEQLLDLMAECDGLAERIMQAVEERRCSRSSSK